MTILSSKSGIICELLIQFEEASATARDRPYYTMDRLGKPVYSRGDPLRSPLGRGFSSRLGGDSPGVQFDARLYTAGCIATRLPTLPGRFLFWGQSKRFGCLQIPEYQMRRVRVHSRFF